jgi:multidrug efflux system membrane fusion protein
MKKLTIAIIVLIVLIIFWFVGPFRKKAGERPSSALPVATAPVIHKDVPVELRTFGTVLPYRTVGIKSQVTGILKEIHFTEGQQVKEGDLLFTIDTAPFELALKQAEANCARTRFQYENARKLAEHEEELLKKGVSSQDSYDQTRTDADALAASVRTDEAALENARLQLGYCSIKSPLDGRTGSLTVHAGNLVKAEDIVLLTINQVKPILVEFAVPQQYLPEIVKRMNEGKLDVQAAMKGEENNPESGELCFIDNEIDRSTGTLRLRATYVNVGQRLWPGQFINVTLLLTVQHDAVVVPSCAVQNGQKGTYVFVVKPDKTVESRLVSVARIRGEDSVISDGLKTGEQVVTDGQMRLKDGVKVEIKTAEGSKAQ